MTPAILRPFHADEVIGTTEAAQLAGKSERCMRNWCLEQHIGRKISGHYGVSRVALEMCLNDDEVALKAYLAGERVTPEVAAYYRRLGIDIPST
jgi:hypothetical protein